MKKTSALMLLLLLFSFSFVIASPQTEMQLKQVTSDSVINDDMKLYGSMAVAKKDMFTMEEMLRYSLEDERMALAEYEMIIDKFNIGRPFTNIIEAEKTHEGLVLDLYKQYGYTVPDFDGNDHVVIPETLKETFEIGIDAEIKNIAMYDKFLSYDLDEGVRVVFTKLRDGSKSHLMAFKKQAEKY